MHDDIKKLEAQRDREWDSLEMKRRHYNELSYEVGDRQREFNSVSEEMITAFDFFKHSDDEKVHEAYLSGKRELDGFIDRFSYDLKTKQREYEDQYDNAGRDMQKMLNKYDDEITAIRRGN